MSFRSMSPHNMSDIPVALAANVAPKTGEIACWNASGWAVVGSAATGLRAFGVFNRNAEAGATNGAAEASVSTSRGKLGMRTFPLKNSGSDPLDQSHVGSACWIEDANTVAATDAGGTLSRAGRLWSFDRDGNPLVEFDTDFDQADIATLESDLAAIPTIRKGSVTLAAGTATVPLAGVTTSTNYSFTITNPGAGAITGLAGFQVTKGAGTFTVTAIDDAKATIATAVCVLDYVAVG